MRSWIRRWRDYWNDVGSGEPVTMSSTAPLDVVRERMRATSSTWQQAAFRGGVQWGILGRIGEYDIDVRAGHIANFDLTLPRFSGRLEPTATGTRVAGWIRPSLSVFPVAREVAYLKSWLADCLRPAEGVDREGGEPAGGGHPGGR